MDKKVGPQLKLFDDSSYIQPHKPDIEHTAEEKISDITQITDSQLIMDFDKDQNADIPKESKKTFNDLVGDLQYHVKDGEMEERDDYFDTITEKMRKSGFNKLSDFNNFFRGLLREVRKQLSGNVLNKTAFDSLVVDEYIEIGRVVLKSFALQNRTIPYPFHGTRYKNMEKICFEKFYSLIPFKKKYTPDEIKKYDLVIVQGDEAFTASSYNSALRFYHAALHTIPDAAYPQKQIVRSLSNLLFGFYSQAKQSADPDDLEASKSEKIFLSVLQKFKAHHAEISENVRQTVQSKVREYILANNL